METVSVTYSYEKRWVLRGMEHYCFTEKKQLINAKTNRIIKMTLVGYTKGYWLGKKFYSLNKLRPLLIRPPKFEIPF